MKNNRTKRFVLSLLLVVGVSVVWAQVRPATLEYWLDAQYDQRQTVGIDGNLTQNIDVSDLRYGVHTIEMRVNDTKGRWGGTVLRYFLKTDPSFADNQLTKYEYWIDGGRTKAKSGKLTDSFDLDIDVSTLCEGLHSLQVNLADKRGRLSQTHLSYFLTFGENPADRKLAKYEYWIDDYANVQTGATSDGNILLDIDVAALGKGIHTLGYQVEYGTGKKSAPHLTYFLIPELEEGVGVIAAYEYWFNRGGRTRVNLQSESSSVALNDVVIEVKDVVPNTLDGYRFMAATEEVTVDDEVFFGMQVCNADGRTSLAVLSDTFPMTVPVELKMSALDCDGVRKTVDAPKSGRMLGMKSEVSAGDSLTYVVSSQNVKADFYDVAGNRLESTETVLDTDDVAYVLKATSACVYALFYDVPDVMNTLSVSLLKGGMTGIDDVASDGAVELARYNVNGQVIHTKQPGINIIRMSDGTVRKVMVK